MTTDLLLEIRCPTCGARQEWTSACLRCQCDLTLLQTALAAYEENRRECLRMLYAGFAREALAHARRCQRLRPGPHAQKLVALCHLVGENWVGAVESGRAVEAGGEGPVDGRSQQG